MKKIIMNNYSIHETTMTLETAFTYFQRYNKARNLATDTINAYDKNYGYFKEFLEWYKKDTEERKRH